ncbi:hypothetical protein Tco_0483550, partial [Tanacetum coccineum]
MVENLYNCHISGAKRWSRRMMMVMTYGRAGDPGDMAIDYQKALHGLMAMERHNIELPEGM